MSFIPKWNEEQNSWPVSPLQNAEPCDRTNFFAYIYNSNKCYGIFFKYKYLKCCSYIVNNFYSPLVLYSVQAVCTFLLCLQWVVFMSAKTSCRLTRSKSKDRLGGCDHNRLLSRYIWDWVLGYGLAGTGTELSHGSSDQRVLPGARALWITSQDLSTWNEEDKQKSCSRHSKMLLGMGQQYFILLESPVIFHFPNLIL